MSGKGLNDDLDIGDLLDVYEELLPIGSKWRIFGLSVGISSSRLNSIAEKNFNTTECFREVLMEYLRNNRDAKWKNIIRILKSTIIGENGLSARLEAVHSAAEVIADDDAKEIITQALKGGALKMRNVVGVVTGLMGSGKTTLLDRLFFNKISDTYTSSRMSEASKRGLLRRIGRLSTGQWKLLTHDDIRILLAPFIKAGMNETDIRRLAISIMQLLDPSMFADSKSGSLDPLSDESTAIQDLVPLVQSSVGANIDVIEMVHMIDTGGQPELLDVMPSFIHNAHLAILVINLEYDLYEPQKANYHEKNVCYTHSTCYTNADIVFKLASSLHGKKAGAVSSEDLRLIVVATHSDCFKDKYVLEEKKKKLDQDLRAILLPAFENELIVCKAGQIAFVLGLKDLKEDDISQLDILRERIGEPGVGSYIDVPTSFFVFEQDLMHHAKRFKRDILSMSECRQVGARLDMSYEVVQAALVLFHHQNTFLRYHNALPNHVFVKPQVPFDILNSIVSFSYKVVQGDVMGLPAKFVTQIEEGIVTEELLSYPKISDHFEKGVYEVRDAINLFCHTFTLAPLEPAKDEPPMKKEKQKYLMMCIKRPIPTKDLPVPKLTDTVPLAIKFSCGCVPLGCFGSMISCLLTKYGWVIVKKGYAPKCLASNIASLHDCDTVVDVLLINYAQHIAVYINSPIQSSPANTCSQVRRKVFGAIKKVFKIMELDNNRISVSPAFICSCSEVHHYTEMVKNCLRCSESTISEPSPEQLLWFGEDSTSEPDLVKLLELDIPEKVGSKYPKFGALLLNDEVGNKVSAMEIDYHFQVEHIVHSILQDWLVKEPTPVTWENLLVILRKCDINKLADHIQKTL